MIAHTLARRAAGMQYAVLVGLALFFGFAFEEFYGSELPKRPGGIRTFPLLSFAGTALYLIEPHFALAFTAGLLVVGSWLFTYVRATLTVQDGRVETHFVVPTSVLLAYVLGPIVLTQPLWASVALVVGAVLLIGSRKALHAFTQRVPVEEVLTLGQFLLLVGVVLPLLYGAPNIPFTTITPFKVWLAVVAVSTLSYASYLVSRYALPRGGIFVTALLGGLYSSTATTVVLARRARESGLTREISAAIIGATAMMYLRIVIVCSIFNATLGRAIAPSLIALGLISLGAAYLLARSQGSTPRTDFMPSNPLQLGTAFVFAVLLVGISLVSTWVEAHLGSGGVLALAAVVGVTDIDPFVLSIAQSGTATIALSTAAVAIVVASSSNNLLKAIYTIVFSRSRASWLPVAGLLAMSLLGLLAAGMVAR